MSRDVGPVRELLDAQVSSGRVPGYAAALHHDGVTQVLVGGTLGVGPTRSVTAATPFRLSSVTKPFAGVLALTLVEDGTLGLDDPVETWLPELAAPVVLRDRHGPLDDTEPAAGPITVRQLLTGTAGIGGIWRPSPLADAMGTAGVSPGPFAPDLDPDEFVHRLAALPLAAQPGSTWLYHVGSDLLGVLLARATGRRVSDLLAERVTGPLGLGARFHADASSLPTAYQPDGGRLDVLDLPDGRFAVPPRFESLATGLVGTAEDVLGLLVALADGGAPVLREDTVAMMTADALTPEQRAPDQDFLGEGMSWGMHVGVGLGTTWAGPGRWGWDGGTGTTAWVDPSTALAGVLLTQRGMAAPEDEPREFWRTVAAWAACSAP